MKTPMPPPAFAMDAITRDPKRLLDILSSVGDDEDYLAWDKIRYKTPPADLTREEWWFGLKFRRMGNLRHLPLELVDGRPVNYGLPDNVLRELDYVSQRASGQLALPEGVISKTSRDRYVVQSLVEEAISLDFAYGVMARV